MIRAPPRTTRTYTLLPYTTPFRSGTRRLRRGSASSGLRGRCRCEPFRGDAPFEFDSKTPTQERLACGRGAMLVVRRHRSASAGASWHSDSYMLRSEEHTSELQSLMRISYAVFCLKKKKKNKMHQH